MEHKNNTNNEKKHLKSINSSNKLINIKSNFILKQFFGHITKKKLIKYNKSLTKKNRYKF